MGSGRRRFVEVKPEERARILNQITPPPLPPTIALDSLPLPTALPPLPAIPEVSSFTSPVLPPPQLTVGGGTGESLDKMNEYMFAMMKKDKEKELDSGGGMYALRNLLMGKKSVFFVCAGKIFHQLM